LDAFPVHELTTPPQQPIDPAVAIPPVLLGQTLHGRPQFRIAIWTRLILQGRPPNPHELAGATLGKPARD
jgi:hypothetical protein